MRLDKRRIAEGGLTLLATGGLDNLTTRKLANHFGIKSASLYYHFKNKQQLLDQVADVMVRPAWRGAHPGECWQDWVIDVASRLRRQILRYPDGALVYAGATPPADRFDETVALLFGPLLNAGISREIARPFLLAVIRFTIGWTADEQVAHVRGADRDATKGDADFEFGLRTLVRGIEALVALEDRSVTPAP